jgi:hypothetical protein
MTLGGFSLVILFIVAFVWMRSVGIRSLDLLSLFANACTFAWLIFLYSFLSPDLYIAQGLRPPGAWIRRTCIALAILLVPTTIRDVVLVVNLRHGARRKAS